MLKVMLTLNKNRMKRKKALKVPYGATRLLPIYQFGYSLPCALKDLRLSIRLALPQAYAHALEYPIDFTSRHDVLLSCSL